MFISFNVFLWPQSFSLQTSLGVIGVAWVGTLCTKYGKNAGLNEKRGNVLATSEVSIKRLNVAVHRLSNILNSDHIEYKRAITVPSLVSTYLYH
jgi:hypothetical protein